MQDRLLTKEEFLEKLKTDREFNSRYGRKHIIEGKMVLPPCHYSWQVYTRELSLEERTDMFLETYNGDDVFFNDDEHRKDVCDDNNIPTRAISLMWNQRSVDVGLELGLPFNMAFYGLLLEIIAKTVNMVPDELIGNLGDTHLYLNHIEPIKEQLTREPFELPTLKINPNNEMRIGGGIFTYVNTDFALENYQSHPPIKLPLSN